MKVNNQTLELMPVFEKLSGAKLKDCFEDTLAVITFVVEHGQIGKALGKKGATLHELQKLLKNPFKIIEFNPDIKAFAVNVVRPTPVQSVEVEGTILTFKAPDFKSRGYLIGKNASTLRNSEAILKKYFSHITEVKVAPWETKHEELTPHQD
jgi:N utilization substance protein A